MDIKTRKYAIVEYLDYQIAECLDYQIPSTSTIRYPEKGTKGRRIYAIRKARL